MLRIGLSACFFHPEPRPIFKNKTLLYCEQTIAQWVSSSRRALSYVIPVPHEDHPQGLDDYAKELDGLILQGGSDVSPKSYGERPIHPEWGGDWVRDRYEIELLNSFLKREKPVLGICRGAQLLNVAFGGTLFQDIPSQVKDSLVHRNWEVYDENFHEIELNGELASLFGQSKGSVNSIHHQGVKDLGKGLIAEARCPRDGIIEAIRLNDKENFVLAVQWHPEFQDAKRRDLLDSAKLLSAFLEAVEKRRHS